MINDIVPVNRSKLLFGNSSDLIKIIDSSKPSELETEIYFTPLPNKDLQKLMQHQNDKRIDQLYDKFKGAKMQLMEQVYQSMGSLIFAIINTDAISNMKKSRELFFKRVTIDPKDRRQSLERGDHGVLDPGINYQNKNIIDHLDGLIAKLNLTLDELAKCSINPDACKFIADTANNFDEYVSTAKDSKAKHAEGYGLISVQELYHLIDGISPFDLFSN